MRSTAIDLFADPALIAQAKADHASRLDGRPFVNPIPDDVMPPLPAHVA
jgi:aminobenzoyl-glutamate utilization protein B